MVVVGKVRGSWVVSILLLLAACTNPTTEPDSAPPETVPAPSTTQATSTPTSEVLSIVDEDVDAGQPSVELDESEFAVIVHRFGYSQWSEVEWDEYIALVKLALTDQELFIGQCMTAEGFEYFLSDMSGAIWRPSYGVDSESEEWMTNYGLGISTTYFPQDVLGEGATGHLGEPLRGPDISEDSPETNYLNSLSPSAYSQYSLTLSGIDPSTLEFDESGLLLTEIDVTIFESSCQAQAQREHPEPLVPFGDTAQIGERVLNSSSWQDYMKTGWNCVRQEGFEAANIEEARTLVGRMSGEVGLYSEEFGEITPSDDSLPTGYVRLLAEVQTFEKRLANVMWDCGVHPIQERAQFSVRLRDLMESKE